MRNKQTADTAGSSGQRESKSAPRKKNKRAAKRRKTFVLFSALILALFLFVFYRHRRHETLTITQTIEYREQVSGTGCLFYNEYAPDFLAGVEVKSPAVSSGTRVSVETGILPLDSAAAQRAQQEMTAKQKSLSAQPESVRGKQAAQIQYLDRVIQAGQVLAPGSTVVHYALDGYEQLCQPESLSRLLPGDLYRNREAQESSSVPGIKFVDNRLFYLAVDLPRATLARSWKVKEDYVIHLSEDVSLTGRLEFVKTADDNAQILVFSLREGYEKVQDIRFCNAVIERGTKTAFLIPIQSVFYENGKAYCYALSSDDVARKTQLDILDSSLDIRQFVVRAWDAEARAQKEERQLRTFDRVLLNPEGIVEGEMY